jgi:hypothetical protein
VLENSKQRYGYIYVYESDAVLVEIVGERRGKARL